MLALAKLMEEGFSRIGLIPFVGAIVVGIVLGRGVLDFIGINNVISFVTSLGIIFLLFLAGTEEFSDEFNLDRRILISSIIQLVIPFIAIYFYLVRIGLSEPFAIVFPLITTSVGPMTRLLMDTGTLTSRLGRLMFYQGTLVEIMSVILFAMMLKVSSPVEIIKQSLEILVLFIAIIFIGPKLSRMLETIEGFVKVREVELAFLVSLILIIGYVADLFGFNSAIAALFLGFLLKDYLKDRPDLKEKVRGLTYGFFEPLFFVSIGLYFAPINLYIGSIGLILAGLIFMSKFLSGLISSFIIKTDSLANAIGMSSKGGVDSSLLISALVGGGISSLQYSYSALSITLVAIIVPILFKLKTRGITTIYSKPKFNERLDKLSQLPNPLFAETRNTLRDIIKMMTERGARAIVIVDEFKRPVGNITVQQLLEIDPSLYDKLRASDVDLNETVIMESDKRVVDALRRFRATETPVIAVVDRDGKLLQTLYERELLRILSNL
ncbi:CBS domain-containing protein [Metallosphaera tengchongensis]|uniref:CBS domain-containing protein n=2 Tax=Metallosphaera tengchongensis TaxID=1532350 RepID=A0A6N0P155_9CREN|nr:CBS domain-containing protein [Metallosphaera tengchongensis]